MIESLGSDLQFSIRLRSRRYGQIDLPPINGLHLLSSPQNHINNGHIKFRMDIKSISLELRIGPYTNFNYQISSIISFTFYLDICVIIDTTRDCYCLIGFGLLGAGAFARRTEVFYFLSFALAPIAYCLHDHHALFHCFEACAVTGIACYWSCTWFSSWTIAWGTYCLPVILNILSKVKNVYTLVTPLTASLKGISIAIIKVCPCPASCRCCEKISPKRSSNPPIPLCEELNPENWLLNWLKASALKPCPAWPWNPEALKPLAPGLRPALNPNPGSELVLPVWSYTFLFDSSERVSYALHYTIITY